MGAEACCITPETYKKDANNRSCGSVRTTKNPAQERGYYVKKLIFAGIATLAMAGCTTITTEQFNALENRVAALESELGSAADAASDASAAASRASREASAAATTAQRALDAANEANERAQRMADTCCAQK